MTAAARASARRIATGCLLAVAALGVAAACANEALLSPFPPEADPSALRVGSVVYACGAWIDSSLARQATAVAVDVHFRPDTAFRGPTDSDVAVLKEHGATVLYEYSFPAARVLVEPARIPALVDSAGANAVVSVPDPARFDWRFVVAVTGALTSDDSIHIVRLGGSVVAMLGGLNYIVAVLPDGSIPYLRRWSRLRFAENESFLCAGQRGAYTAVTLRAPSGSPPSF